MNITRAWKWIAVALVVQMAAVGSVWADDAAAKSGAAKSGLTSDQNLSLIDEDIEGMTGQQKLDRAATKVEQMRAKLAQVSELLQKVRNQGRDIIKINCINEKHAAIKGFVKVSEQSYINLKGAVSQSDTGAAEHHYTLVAVANQKVRNLAGEAQLCTGEEQRFSGKAQIDVAEPDVADGDVDAPRDNVLVADLPELTPYQ